MWKGEYWNSNVYYGNLMLLGFIFRYLLQHFPEMVRLYPDKDIQAWRG